MELAQRIEAILFWKGEPVVKTALLKMLGCSAEDLTTACTTLSDSLNGRGIRLVTTETELSLMTAPEMSELIDTLRKDEMKRDIGKAGAETLAIVLYKGPISRSEIDYIRGVNSSFILRNLMMRGLVERVDHPSDKRSFAYATTPELLAHLGITNARSLPNYEAVLTQLETFEKEQRQEAGDTSEVLP